MERQYPDSNEIFEPKTVSNVMTLANESTGVLVCLVDIEQRCYIWLDVESDRVGAYFENTKSKTAQTIRAVLEGGRLTVYDLLSFPHGTVPNHPCSRQVKTTNGQRYA